MKSILISFIIISILVLMGCDEIDVTKLTKEDINKIIICDPPYIRYASECCLDQDNNSICDKDEAVSEEDEEISCSDECSTDTCENNDYISCLKKEDGCRDKVNKGKILGKCGVECITDDDCSLDEECKNYKCEINQEEENETEEETCIDECFDSSCLGLDFIDCVSKSDGCRDKVNKGKILGKCGVDCFINSDCSIDRKCEDYQCVEIIRTRLELENYEISINILNSSYFSSTKQVVTNTCDTYFTVDMDTDEYFIVTKIDGEAGESAVLQLTKVHDTSGVTVKDYTGTVIAENKRRTKTFDAADMTITVNGYLQSGSWANFTISDSLCANNMIITKDGEKIDIPFE